MASSSRLRFIGQAGAALVVCAGLAGIMVGAYWWVAGICAPDPKLTTPPHQMTARAAPPPETQSPYREIGAGLLRELVRRDLSLPQEGLTEWETVNRIRDWAHANIRLATPRALLDADPSFQFFTKSAPEIFTAFFKDQGGVWCGGAAHALMTLYGLFGFEASTLDFGRVDVMTHVVTLVKIRHEGQERIVIQDPSFNVTYANRRGAPLDYFALLATLLRHEHQGIRILPGRLRQAAALVHPEDDDYSFGHVVDASGPPVTVLANRVKKYTSRLSFRSADRLFGRRIRAFLREEGHPGERVYLFLYPLAGSDRSVVEKAKQLTARQ